MGSEYCCPDEQWVAIPGHEGRYEVSSCGRARSIARWQVNSLGRRRLWPGQLLRPGKAKGYLLLAISSHHTHVYKTVHSAVLQAFGGPRPVNLVVCHDDGNHLNNHLTNLRWDTYRANSLDTLRHGANHSIWKTHCPQMHLLEPPNLRMYGARSCLVCARARAYARRREPGFDWIADADARYRKLGFQIDRAS